MAVKLGAVLLVFGLSLVWPASAHRKLLVFLLDGFRSDYISEEVLASLPGFREIVSRGVKVDYLTPDFPSLSYPNYYTLMTGEYLPRPLLGGEGTAVLWHQRQAGTYGRSQGFPLVTVVFSHKHPPKEPVSNCL